MTLSSFQRCLIEMNKLDRTEIQAYKVLIPELAKFELTHFSSSLLQKLTPRLFAGKFDLSPESRGFFMVLEDVSLDFQARNFNSGLTKNEVITALTNLAEFHAIAHAFAKTGKINLKETFPFLSNFMVCYPLKNDICIIKVFMPSNRTWTSQSYKTPSTRIASQSFSRPCKACQTVTS